MNTYEQDRQRLRDLLERAKEKLAEQAELLKELTEGPTPFGYVLNTYRITTLAGDKKNVALIVTGQNVLEVNAHPNLKVKAGDTVRLSPRTGQITGRASELPIYGDIRKIIRVVDKENCEVLLDNNERVISVGNLKDLREGDRVVLDPMGIVALKKLSKEKSFEPETIPNISWNDIGGQEAAIKQMRELIELPLTHASLFKKYGRKPAKGVLLYGPPGCGKTLLAKAAAAAIQGLHKKKTENNGFLYLKGPEILSRWVGAAEATIRTLFHNARQFQKETGHPAVVFIDEADAIFMRRGSGISSDIDKTIVPQFLAEMDGLEDSGAFLILATNRPDSLDPAVVRDGRIDRKIKIDRPTAISAPDIFKIHFKGKWITGNIDKLAAKAAEELFDPKYSLYEIEKQDNTVISMTLGHVCNGAMIAGIVDHALSAAMNRELSGEKSSGMTEKDLSAAIAQIFEQQFDLNHTDDLQDFVAPIKSEITSLKKRKSNEQR